ncbi:MAG TPA: extracellular solute-binding protein [Gaiellaceae bacterium]|jgi:N,N'-diacetylchitobiose transport system substrate-binding protein
MRVRVVVAAALAVACAVVATTASAATGRAQANKLTVWLQVDAQSGWPDVVAAANQQFQQQNPGWTVSVQYQSWGDHLQKFDATIAGNDTPDVIEMGNTEMTAYMSSGAFADLSGNKSQFPNSGSWLAGLAKSGMFGGKLYGVPYYAGSRVVTYRSDLFKKAGVTKAPTSIPQFTADLQKVATMQKGVKGFTPMYLAGTDWYSALDWVFDYGGSIATTHAHKWVGTLDSPQSVAGLTAFKNFFGTVASKSAATLDEANPAPYTVYSQGLTAAILGPAWFSCCTGTKYKSVTAQFVMPSHSAGKPIPGFLGGSDLAIPAQSGNKSQAIQWISDFTNSQNEQTLQAKGNIPNATSLLGNTVNARAAARSWFVPQAKHWVDVENGNILRTMLAQILTGKLSVKQAAATASANIAYTLNQS